MRKLITAMVCGFVLAGCQLGDRLGLGGGETAVAEPSVPSQATTLRPDAIEVSVLDAPADLPSAQAVPDAQAEQPQASSAPAAPVASTPPVRKSASQLTCEARGGIWSKYGSGVAAFCQTPTKDAGKSCRSSEDCSGYCLAKSNSCAPVTPMLGCNEILNEAGRVLTECIN